MKRLQNEPVDDNSLHNAINYISGNFAIGLEDPQRIAQFAINTERYNMPADYYQNYLKNLSAVTAQDVQNMAKKYIDPDHANIVVAGSKETVAGKLASFSADGKVSYYDNYGKPMVISDAKPLPPGVTAESIYKNYITAIGGEKAISAIKDIKSVSKGEVQGIPLTITEMKKAPGKMKVVVTGTMQGKTMTFQKQVFDGTKGYTEAQGQKAEMKGEELDDVKEQADIAADLHPEKYGIKRALKSMDKIDGKDVYVVEATDKNNKSSTEYYEVSTSYLLRKVTATETPQGKVSQISDFKDYAEVPGSNGYKVPYTIGQSGGGFDITAKVEKVEINKNIPDSEFK